MASRLTLARLTATLCLAGCGSIMQLSTEDALEMRRNALLAYDGGEDAKAEALFVGLLRVSPNDPETLLRLGNLYARSGRPEHAADTYHRALLLTPNDDRLWYNLGIIRQRQAHAAYIQAQQLSKPGEEIHDRSERLLKQVAPAKEGDDRSQESSSNAPAGT